METSPRIFKIEQRRKPTALWADMVILAGLAAVIYLGVHLARLGESVIEGPAISLSPRQLPCYAAFSIGRMIAAYALSFIFSLAYGYFAATNRRAERILLPVLDVLQSVPIFSFLPVAVLSLTAVLPLRTGTELASIVLIFTCQVWNMTFAWYQSLTTIPHELREVGKVFGFSRMSRLKIVELPFGAIGLIWNSMMSWAGGWFFLMAAEMFTVGRRDFRLPGLGAYLAEAAGRGDLRAIAWGIGALILIIVALDQLVWRPLLAWADRFKLELVEDEEPPGSWFYEVLLGSRLLRWLRIEVLRPLSEELDAVWLRLFPINSPASAKRPALRWLFYLFGLLCAAGFLYGVYLAARVLAAVPAAQWAHIGVGLGATLLRVLCALGLALAWTVPLGVAIGTNPRLAAILQPIVQIAASLPATALFPVFLIVMLKIPGGLSLAAVLLMLMGTQWYLLFNAIAGAAMIPKELKHTAVLLHMSRLQRWRTMVLPALFPSIITGGLAASGGAWNASVVAEYVQFGGQTVHTVGIGALIAQAAASGNYPLLLASTLSMIVTVVLINRLGWRRLYRLAQERFRME
jgi:NitT/TauT family transport system permease protein